jgi:hypothetical protein
MVSDCVVVPQAVVAVTENVVLAVRFLRVIEAPVSGCSTLPMYHTYDEGAVVPAGTLALTVTEPPLQTLATLDERLREGVRARSA